MKRAKRIDPWIMVSVVILALYLLFLIYPMFNVLGRSVVEDGKLTLKYFITFFSQEYYISTLWNCSATRFLRNRDRIDEKKSPILRSISEARSLASTAPKQRERPTQEGGLF